MSAWEGGQLPRIEPYQDCSCLGILASLKLPVPIAYAAAFPRMVVTL